MDLVQLMATPTEVLPQSKEAEQPIILVKKRKEVPINS